MPRSLQEIIDHAGELADRFENDEPGEAVDGTPLRDLAGLVEQRSHAESAIRAGVGDARLAGISWAAIGAILGTSGEAVRQRYGVAHIRVQPSTGRISGTRSRGGVKKMGTSKKDASAASRQLSSKSSTKAQKSVAASDLSQAKGSAGKKKVDPACPIE
jgi:hypothetical protein